MCRTLCPISRTTSIGLQTSSYEWLLQRTHNHCFSSNAKASTTNGKAKLGRGRQSSSQALIDQSISHSCSSWEECLAFYFLWARVKVCENDNVRLDRTEIRASTGAVEPVWTKAGKKKTTLEELWADLKQNVRVGCLTSNKPLSKTMPLTTCSEQSNSVWVKVLLAWNNTPTMQPSLRSN